MSWQDTVLAAGQFAFTLALLPSVFSTQKPSRWTCFLTGTILFVYSGIYYSMGFMVSLSSVLLCAGVWTVLLFQSRPTNG